MKIQIIAIIAAILFAGALAAPQQSVSTVKCTACKTVISIIDHWLEEGKTHEQIEKLIKDVCSLLGPQYAQICTVILDVEIEQLIKWLESFEPEIVCRKLRLCPASNTNSIKCEFCKLVIDAVENYIEDPKTEQQIIKFLDKICAYIPKYEAICDQLIAYGVMELVELIKQYGDPATVCGYIGLC